MSKVFTSFKFIGFLALLLGLFFLFFVLIKKEDGRLNEAADSYIRGENSKTVAERKEAFNQALNIYLQLDNDYRPLFGDGKLYFNIANTYFQLEKYAYAILYGEKAKALSPRDERVERNLAIARKKLDLTQPEEHSFLEKVFFYHFYWSLPERLQAFFLAGMLCLLFASCYIWKLKSGYKKGAIFFFAVMLFLLADLTYTRFFSPLEGIVVQSAELRRDAGPQYAQVMKQPVPAGTKVEVLNTSADGLWLKILTPEGNLGYVTQNSLRVISAVD